MKSFIIYFKTLAWPFIRSWGGNSGSHSIQLLSWKRLCQAASYCSCGHPAADPEGTSRAFTL